MKNNSHKKRVFQDNFIKHYCCSSHNHPLAILTNCFRCDDSAKLTSSLTSGWVWWKRHNRKVNRRKLKSEMQKDMKDVMDSGLEVMKSGKTS